MSIVYKLADGRLWSVEKADWIDEAQMESLARTCAATGEDEPCVIEALEVIPLQSAEGKSDPEYLARTLEFYGYPLGSLALENAAGIKEALEALDTEYLTPRTLAGLSVNDETAIARWQEHEEKAAPLRERLAELEKAE